MEDILASIRKIIDEDDSRGDTTVRDAQDDAAPDDDIVGLAEIADDEDAEPLDLAEVIEAEAEADVPEMPEAAEADPPEENDGEAAVPEAEEAAHITGTDVSHVPEDIGIAPVADAVPDNEKPLQEEKPMSDDGLMSEATRSSAAAALGSLARATERDPLEGVPQGRPIEQLVMEQLRPMLSQWLDENLPAIVERIVEREVRYLSRRLEGDDRN